MARPRKNNVTKVKVMAEPTEDQVRAGLETRAWDQGIDPTDIETAELEKLVLEAEAKATSEAAQGRPAVAPQPRKGKKAEAKKFYKSLIANLRLGNDEGSNVSERFTAYLEDWQGDKRRIGYLASDNAYVQDMAAKDPNVEEISEDEYAKATDVTKGAQLVG